MLVDFDEDAFNEYDYLSQNYNVFKKYPNAVVGYNP